jgi:hypothetical protein
VTPIEGRQLLGVATDEPACRFVDDWKQTRLIEAGADYIIPNFLRYEELLQALFTDLI